MMHSAKLFAMVIFAVSLLFAGYAMGGQQYQETREQSMLRFGNVSLQERGPAVSSPQTLMAPNGDRLSPYPPYFHPEPGGANR